MLEIYNGKARTSLIIFIHGFTGGVDTWINNEEHSIWANLAADKTITDNYDLAVFDYFTKLTDLLDKPVNFFNSFIGKKKKRQFNISIIDIADLLKSELRYKATNYKRIVLVAHSMGGLISKCLILNELDDQNRSSVDLFISLAVPHRGSELATFGKKILKNPQVKNLGPLDKTLNEMEDQWIKYGERLYPSDKTIF